MLERDAPEKRTMTLAMVVADINNPVFHGMVRGAERRAAHLGYHVLVVETQESEAAERSAVQRVLPSVDGIILSSSRISDGSSGRCSGLVVGYPKTSKSSVSTTSWMLPC